MWPYEFTVELLELIWVLERSLALAPEQQALVDSVINPPLIAGSKLPEPPKSLQQAPKVPGRKAGDSLF